MISIFVLVLSLSGSSSQYPSAFAYALPSSSSNVTSGKLTSSSSSSSRGETKSTSSGKALNFKGFSSSKVIIEATITKNDKKNISPRHHGLTKFIKEKMFEEGQGEGSSSSSSSPSLSSLIKWLENDELSNPTILGSKNIKQVSENLFDCIQPSVSWFGLDIIPVFVSHISRQTRLLKDDVSTSLSISNLPKLPFSTRGGTDAKHTSYSKDFLDDASTTHYTTTSSNENEYKIEVEIKDSRTDLGNLDQKRVGKSAKLVKKLMETCKFKGKNTIICRRIVQQPYPDGSSNDNRCTSNDGDSENEVWEISSDLAIELKIPLPASKLIILPPGFNAIGSRIVRRICNQRGQETLNEIKSQYFKWLSSTSSA